MEREQEDRRRSKLFRAEIANFTENLERRLETRAEALDKEEAVKNDFEDAAWILEETERLKREGAERERIRRREERERQMREAMLAREQALKEEAERKEQERLAKLAEEERLRMEEEARLEEERRIQQEKDTIAVEVYSREIQYFLETLNSRSELRRETDAIYKRKK
jgi:hypothetical protein